MARAALSTHTKLDQNSHHSSRRGSSTAGERPVACRPTSRVFKLGANGGRQQAAAALAVAVAAAARRRLVVTCVQWVSADSQPPPSRQHAIARRRRRRRLAATIGHLVRRHMAHAEPPTFLLFDRLVRNIAMT